MESGEKRRGSVPVAPQICSIIRFLTTGRQAAWVLALALLQQWKWLPVSGFSGFLRLSASRAGRRCHPTTRLFQLPISLPPAAERSLRVKSPAAAASAAAEDRPRPKPVSAEHEISPEVLPSNAGRRRSARVVASHDDTWSAAAAACQPATTPFSVSQTCCRSSSFTLPRLHYCPPFPLPRAEDEWIPRGAVGRGEGPCPWLEKVCGMIQSAGTARPNPAAPPPFLERRLIGSSEVALRCVRAHRRGKLGELRACVLGEWDGTVHTPLGGEGGDEGRTKLMTQAPAPAIASHRNGDGWGGMEFRGRVSQQNETTH